MLYAFVLVLLEAAAYGIGYRHGRSVERRVQKRRQQVAEAHEEALREHRARRLREFGRIHDVREDATGAPAIVRPMHVLGRSPRHKPPTTM